MEDLRAEGVGVAPRGLLRHGGRVVAPGHGMIEPVQAVPCRHPAQFGQVATRSLRPTDAARSLRSCGDGPLRGDLLRSWRERQGRGCTEASQVERSGRDCVHPVPWFCAHVYQFMTYLGVLPVVDRRAAVR